MMFEKVSFYETQEKTKMIMVVKMRKHIVKSYNTSFDEILKKLFFKKENAIYCCRIILQWL